MARPALCQHFASNVANQQGQAWTLSWYSKPRLNYNFPVAAPHVTPLLAINTSCLWQQQSCQIANSEVFIQSKDMMVPRSIQAWHYRCLLVLPHSLLKEVGLPSASSTNSPYHCSGTAEISVRSFLHLLATRGYHEVASKLPKMQCFNYGHLFPDGASWRL